MRKFLFLLLMLVLSVNAAFAQGAAPGMLRIAHLPFDGKPVTVSVDSSAFTNPDGSPETLNPASVTLYRPLDAGKHQVSWMAEGGMASAPIDVTVEAGHRYTLAVLGSAGDISTQWIDETAGYEKAGIDPSASPQLFINNLKGAPALDIQMDGKSLGLNVAYGDYGFAVITPANYKSLAIVAADDDKTTLFSTPIFFEPATAYVSAMTGMFSSAADAFGKDFTLVYSEYSPRILADFLAGFSGKGLGFAALDGQENDPFTPQIFSFDTAIKAFDAAGLSSILTGSEEHTIFVPTDEAFAALPAGTLDGLMADPAKLRDLLMYHIADGRVGFDQLSAWGKITTLQGGDLTVAMTGEGALGINGTEAGCGCNYDLANGHVYIVDHVLMPKS